MALVLADRVLETTTTVGSGTITLAGAKPGYQSFAAIGDGNTTYYTIAGVTEWEVGIGTYTASGTTLSRDTVLSSSFGGSKVAFSAGTKDVFVDYPSEKAIYPGTSGNISALSGKIINLAAPENNSDAATKLYVDDLVSTGLYYHDPVQLASTSAFTSYNITYNNGTSGVSATITQASSYSSLTIDSTAAAVGNRILIKDAANSAYNGVYVVNDTGSGSTPFVMMRSTDTDSYGTSEGNLSQNDYFYVQNGAANKGSAYVCNTQGTIVFGTTAITFAQFSTAQVYSAGTGLTLTNTTFALDTPVSTSNGGTGQTTYTNGQLLIGNSSGNTLTKSTLTAGTGISITNGNGSIAISVSGTIGGDVVGPSGATANAVARFDGATGKLLKDTSNFIIDGSNNVGVGGTTSADTKMNFTGTAPVSANYSYGIANRMDVPSGAGSAAYAFYSEANGSGTVPWFHHFYAAPGASVGNITTRYGFNVTDGLLTTGNIYGVMSDIKTAVGYTRFSVYAPGTAPNYFGGNTLIGGTAGGAVATEALEISAGNKFRINGATSGYTTLKAPTTGNNINYTLPSADGTTGQFLKTDGSGTLSWSSAGGGAQDYIVQSFGIV